MNSVGRHIQASIEWAAVPVEMQLARWDQNIAASDIKVEEP